MADKRILTTHAGSLPRPARLVELYAARAKGEKIDEAELVREGEAATRWVVEKQREAGIDIPSDGEQLREAFFLYVQRRMTGFSGKWKRPMAANWTLIPSMQDDGASKLRWIPQSAISPRRWRREPLPTRIPTRTKRNFRPSPPP